MTFIQALEMMGKLWEINGRVRLLIDKFPGIRAELIYSNDNQQEWNFQRFVENPRQWTERNPVESREKQISFQPRKERILQTSQKWWMKNHCIFCKEASHNLIDCKKVTNISERKRIVVSMKLSWKAKEHVATVMASITLPYATRQSNRNHRLLKVTKSC